MAPITANSVLPAIRTPIHIRTADQLELVGELASPEQPEATIICVHPLPLQGGMMDSHVFRKMSWRLPSLANIAVLRFNSRGTTSAAGTSEGTFDHAEREGLDLQAAIDFCLSRDLPNIWVIGWSFGTDVILKNLDDPNVRGAILLSPPLRYTSEIELKRWNGSGYQVLALIPELDDFLAPDQAALRFAAATDIEIEPVQSAKHLWVGEKFVYYVLNRVVEVITPMHVPLPTEWGGPMDRWSDL